MGSDSRFSFGSAHCRRRSDPAYQAERLAMLCDFAVALAGAYHRQVRAVQRRTREIWQGSRWLDQQVADQKQWIGKLEAGKGWLDEEVARQKDWIATLEKDKAWLEEQRRNWMTKAEERARLLDEQKSQIDRLQAANADLEQRARAGREELDRQTRRVAELTAKLARSQGPEGSA